MSPSEVPSGGLGPERVRQLAEQFGTPLYLYEGERFEQQFQLLKSCLPAEFGLFYAVKANPLLAVLRIFRRLGGGAEVGSEGELALAREAGFDPADIIYTCPGKTASGVELAIRSGIGCISVESAREAELVESVAERAGKRVPVAVRVNPGSSVSQPKLKMSGVPSQFGIDEEDLGEFAVLLKSRLRRLDWTGLHVYSGTQILQAEEILAEARQTLDLARRISRMHGFQARLIDLGGGFGVAYQDDEPALRLDQLREGYRELGRQAQKDLPGVRLAVESGRFLTAAGGTFITRVLSVKCSRGAKFVICDGGYSHHPASFFIGRFGRNRHPVEALQPSSEKERVTVVGPSGTPVDILARDIWLDRVKAGDLLRVGKSGAYGYTNSCQLFFSGPSPAEVMVHRGQVQTLRRRASFADASKEDPKDRSASSPQPSRFSHSGPREG